MEVVGESVKAVEELCIVGKAGKQSGKQEKAASERRGRGLKSKKKVFRQKLLSNHT